MSDRAAQLAATFERTNESVIATIQACSDEQLRTVCNGEGWPVVVTAHHLALSYQPIAGMARCIATGQPLPPITMDELDSMNAQHAEECATVSREETIALLRREGKAAADSIRRLTDEQLGRTAPIPLLAGQTLSASDMIENGLIGHPTAHGDSIKATLGR